MIGERFWSKVRPAEALECWLWTGATNAQGYGLFNIDGRSRLAHRIAFEALRCDIPTGLCLDHLCRVPACINPWHLEPVTRAVNSARGVRKTRQTHCKAMHELAGANLLTTARQRVCLACKRRTDREYHYRKAIT